MHPAPVLAYAVHVVMEAAPDPRTALDSAPIWRVEVRTVMRRRVVQLVPVVPVS